MISFNKQRRIVAYLNGLSERVNALRWLQAESQLELPPTLRSGDAAASAGGQGATRSRYYHAV